jgi:hypothetical protein
MAFCGIGIESLHGMAIDVLARAQSTAIAADKVFIVWGKNLPFEEGNCSKEGQRISWWIVLNIAGQPLWWAV